MRVEQALKFLSKIENQSSMSDYYELLTGNESEFAFCSALDFLHDRVEGCFDVDDCINMRNDMVKAGQAADFLRGLASALDSLREQTLHKLDKIQPKLEKDDEQ